MDDDRPIWLSLRDASFAENFADDRRGFLADLGMSPDFKLREQRNGRKIVIHHLSEDTDDVVVASEYRSDGRDVFYIWKTHCYRLSIEVVRTTQKSIKYTIAYFNR